MAAFPSTIALWSNGLANLLADLLGRSKGLGFLALEHEVVPGLSFGYVKPKPVRSEEFLAVLAHERAEHWV